MTRIRPDRPSRDLGIDLVAEDRTGRVWAIQAKAYDPDYSVTKRDVDSFLAASSSKRFSYRLLVATTDRIAANAWRTIEDQAIQVGMLLRSDLAAAELTWPTSPGRMVAPKPSGRSVDARRRRPGRASRGRCVSAGERWCRRTESPPTVRRPAGDDNATT